MHNGSGAGWMACAGAPELPPDAALAAAAAAGCAAPDAAEGAAFELNNVLPYLVRAADQGAGVCSQRRAPVLGQTTLRRAQAANEGDGMRIDLVMDVAEAPPARRSTLRPGAVCAYREQTLVC